MGSCSQMWHMSFGETGRDSKLRVLLITRARACYLAGIIILSGGVMGHMCMRRLLGRSG